MVERQFQFGDLSVISTLKGLLGESPAFEVSFSVRNGPSYVGRIKSSGPFPSSPALYVVKEMRRLLKMGIQRFVQFRMMQERRLPQETQELRDDAAKMYMLALGAGDKTLAEAEKGLEASLKGEQEDFERVSAQVAKEKDETNAANFDLGPIRMNVRLDSVMPGERGDMGVFQVTAEVPGIAPHVATVASDDALMAAQAAWYLAQLEAVLAAGPDTFYAQNLEKVRGDAEEGRQFAYSLYQVASALGQAGIEHARGILQLAAAEELDDADRSVLEALEEELKEVRAEIAKRKHRRQPRGS